jgi:hypothetical protein
MITELRSFTFSPRCACAILYGALYCFFFNDADCDFGTLVEMYAIVIPMRR